MMRGPILSYISLLIVLLQQSLFAYELGIVTMFRNEAPYLKEWIEYHRMLGVDHFLLYNDRSDDNWKQVLEPYIKSKLVEVIKWDWDKKYEYTCPLFPSWQTMAYQDGLKRSKGNTKWLAFIDIDEFILPKKNKTILECLQQHFSSASAVYICWRNFGTGNIHIPPKEPIITRLTMCTDPLHPRNACGKSIVRVAQALIQDIWSPHQITLKPGAQYYNGSGKPLYFKELDLQVDPVHTSEYIQINHYAMRDENYFQRRRLPRALLENTGILTCF